MVIHNKRIACKRSFATIFKKSRFLQFKQQVNFEIAITEMYPRILWELVADSKIPYVKGYIISKKNICILLMFMSGQ